MPVSTTREDSAKSSTSYLSLAGALYQGHLSEGDLQAAVIQLPSLDQECLDKLAQIAHQASLTQPRRGWALMAVADAAAQQGADLFLQSLAAWHLSRAANRWFRPNRVEEAVNRARAGFAKLNEPGWLAACDWQRHAVPWMWPDFYNSVTKLEAALIGMRDAGLTDFVPACRLSLAFAHLLTGNFSAAAVQTEKAEAVYQEAQDQLGIGRCLYTRASYQRRSSNLEPALLNTQRALDIFQQLDATVHVAITRYSLGHIVRTSQSDYAAAEKHFQQAVNLFTACDLPLWVAQCYGGLAQGFTYRGQLREADQLLQHARQIYEQHHVPGLWADNLLDSGRLAFFKGQYTTSLSFLEKAEVLFQEVGNQWMPVVALMDQGEVCLQQGRYHEALRRLEKAHVSLKQFEIPYRQAECEWRLAEAWLHLGHTQRAHEYLDQATDHYEQGGHFGYMVDAYNRRAEIYLLDQQWDTAVSFLQEAQVIAHRQGAVSQTALSKCVLGEALCGTGRPEEALLSLQEAMHHFANIGMVIEEAACNVVLGRCYQQLNNTQSAGAAWRQALALSEGAVPGIDWQALAGLAEIALEQDMALPYYRQSLTALAQLRRNLWQPALVNFFLKKRPVRLLDQAVSLAMNSHSVMDAFHFVEESKAQTVARRLTGDGETAAAAQETLGDLNAEIRWLQQELGKANKSGPFATSKVRDLNRQFIQKVKAYDTAVSQIERATFLNSLSTKDSTLNLSLLQQQTTAQLGKKWLALNYYVTEDEVFAVMIGPNECHLWHQPLSSAAYFALRLATRGGYNDAWTIPDLVPLGGVLFPPAVTERITPDTYLIIVPHRQFHHLPWAALPYGPEARPLVTGCVPVIVPSLQSLLYLWQREPTGRPVEQVGLLVAVSEFQGRHARLLAVKREVKILQSLLGERIQTWADDQATLASLSQLSANGQLSKFAFMHVATHAFTDQLTGRLSGLALYDDDLWLDGFMQLAPMPPLLILSACSGLRSLLYEGDEHVGIAVTCLAAGAQTVIGSLWSVPDDVVPDLLFDFYRHLLANQDNAVALARAQRSALTAGVAAALWGGFQCVGRP